jgi:hypothetical protein
LAYFWIEDRDMSNEQDKTKKALTQIEALYAEYMNIFGDVIDTFVSREKAYEAGESSDSGKVQMDAVAKYLKNRDKDTNLSPYAEPAHLHAILEMMANHNRLLIELIEDYMTHKHDELSDRPIT